MPQNSSLHFFGKTFLDALLLAWVLITIGGIYMTFFHRTSVFLPSLVSISYGMLAPYQSDSSSNVEPILVAWEASGASKPLSMEKYFPGVRGERNSRMRLEKFHQDPMYLARGYESFLAQILQHERMLGHEYVRLDLYWEEWPRSPLGYQALRMQSERFFITQVR